MKSRQSVHTAVFAAFLLLAGVLNVCARQAGYYLNTVMFCAQLLLYAGLLMFWLQSVYNRLLPSRPRAYIITAAMLMLLYLALRTVRYRVAHDAVFMRLCWYAYYAPVLLAPTLFLMSCVCIRREQRLLGLERLLLLPALALLLGMLTNDAHCLAFAPHAGVQPFYGNTGTYTYGPLFYITYAWVYLTMSAAILMLTAAARRMENKRAAVRPFLFLLLLPVLAGLIQGLKQESWLRLYEYPEICIFCMLGAIEMCIRSRFMPCNSDYVAFFAAMRMPAAIADRALRTVYKTEAPLNASAAQLKAALSAPVYLNGDMRLHGKALGAGHVFWAEDESRLRRLNEQLEAANGALEGENELMEEENRLRERRAHVALRNRVYAQVSERMYPAQKRLAELLQGVRPEDAAFRDTIARALVIGAYIKRGTNLLLAEAEKDRISSRELYLALCESARYLGYCGMRMQVAAFEETPIPREEALSLYTCFEEMLEAWQPLPARLSAAFSEGELRLITDASGAPAPRALSLPLRTEESDGVLYLTLTAKGGGAA